MTLPAANEPRRRPRAAYGDLTDRGRARRLRGMAQAALAHYDVHVRQVDLVANHLNGTFRVRTAGATYALRISHPTWRTDGDRQAELAWLQALRRDTDLGAPTPVHTRSGDLVVAVAAPGVPEARRCVLLTWLPGPDLADRLTDRGVFRLGELAARLHAHGAGWTPPAGFSARRLGGVYARGEADLLASAAACDVIAAGDRAIFAEASRHVADVHAALMAAPQALHVIHNDLNQTNMRSFRGRLRPLDFEDVAVGHPVQDIASTFGDLLFYTGWSHAAYCRARDAFTRGYASLRPWPEPRPGLVDGCMAGRLIWRANYALRFQPERARQFAGWAAARLRVFLQEGIMRR